MKSFGPETSKENIKLIDKLKANGIIEDPSIEKVLKSIDRADFVDSGSNPEIAYADRPQGIGYNVNISAPHMHAYAMVGCVFKSRNT